MNQKCRSCYSDCDIEARHHSYLGCVCAAYLEGVDPALKQKVEGMLTPKQQNRLSKVIKKDDDALMTEGQRKYAKTILKLRSDQNDRKN